MRLSPRDVNTLGIPSKSSSAPFSQVDVNALCASSEAWPPLLPSFVEDTAAALNIFVQGFICKRIEYRCGQLSSDDYAKTFLSQWIRVAEHRTELIESFFAQQGSRIGEGAFQRIFGAFEKLQSALRDAWQEVDSSSGRQHDKKISFARPVAHRLIRRSRDRFSLRSIADVDDGIELERLSGSPRTSATVGLWLDSPPPVSGGFSPLPCANEGLRGMALTGREEARDSESSNLPVEESVEGDRFTGRASGVYYGDLFHSARRSLLSGNDVVRSPTTSPLADEGGRGSEQTVDIRHLQQRKADEGKGGAEQTLENRLTALQGPFRDSWRWRRFWIRFFYYFFAPLVVLLGLLAYHWQGLMALLWEGHPLHVF